MGGFGRQHHAVTHCTIQCNSAMEDMAHYLAGR